MVVLLTLVIVGHATADDTPWKLRRDQDNIQVYTRKVAGSPYDEVRTTTTVESLRLSSLVALLQDASACTRWVERCASSHIMTEVSDREAFSYTHNNMPFPIRDRDVVSHIRWHQDATTRSIIMRGEAVDGMVETVEGRVRITNAEVTWHFEPLSGTLIHISNQAHVNPGSRLPAWLTNSLLVDAPFRSMQAFIREARTERYRNAQVSFVSEPNPAVQTTMELGAPVDSNEYSALSN